MPDNEISITIVDCAKESKNITSVESLEEFLVREIEFWKQKNQEIPDRPTIQQYNQLLTKINGRFNVLKNSIGREDVGSLQQRANDFVSQSKINAAFVFSDNPAVVPFLRALEKSQDRGNGYLQVIKNQAIHVPLSAEGFLGAVYAYEFITKDESEMAGRTEAEKVTLESLRISLADKKDELISQVAQFQKDVSENHEELKAKVEKWQKEKDDAYTAFCDETNKKREEMEKLYIEKLRLEGPAHYWNKSAKKFFWQGIVWSSLMGLVTIGGIILFYKLFLICTGLEIDPAMHFKYIQGIIILMTSVSLVAFLIRTLSKLAFSSFHLQRDAEEREQLVTLYLSLMHENKIDEKSRDIVLQALFSRTETGLLSKEHGPTMPTTAINDIFGKGTGK